MHDIYLFPQDQSTVDKPNKKGRKVPRVIPFQRLPDQTGAERGSHICIQNVEIWLKYMKIQCILLIGNGKCKQSL